MFQFLHWDSDEAFVTGQPLYGERMRGWLEQPQYRRMFFGYAAEVLRLCGNMSSPTCLFVMERALAAGDIRPGDSAVLTALGPGFSSELVLMRGAEA